MLREPRAPARDRGMQRSVTQELVERVRQVGQVRQVGLRLAIRPAARDSRITSREHSLFLYLSPSHPKTQTEMPVLHSAAAARASARGSRGDTADEELAWKNKVFRSPGTVRVLRRRLCGEWIRGGMRFHYDLPPSQFVAAQRSSAFHLEYQLFLPDRSVWVS